MAVGSKKRKGRQFLVDEQGRKTAVVLPVEEYEALCQAAEDLADLRAAEEAREEGGEPIPWEKVKTDLHAKRKKA